MGAKRKNRPKPIALVASLHATRSGYTAGCRCVDCAAANAAYQRAYYKRRGILRRAR